MRDEEDAAVRVAILRAFVVAILVALAALTIAAALTCQAAHAAEKTLGNTAVGPIERKTNAGYKFGSIFTLTEAGTLRTFSFRARGGAAAQKYVPVIYAVTAAGIPSALVTVGAEVTVEAAQPAEWVTSALPAVTLAPGRYWLGLLGGPTSQNAMLYRAAGGMNHWWNANAYPTPAEAFGPATREDFEWSFFVTYETAATGGGPILPWPERCRADNLVACCLAWDRPEWTKPEPLWYRIVRDNGVICGELREYAVPSRTGGTATKPAPTSFNLYESNVTGCFPRPGERVFVQAVPCVGEICSPPTFGHWVDFLGQQVTCLRARTTGVCEEPCYAGAPYSLPQRPRCLP